MTLSDKEVGELLRLLALTREHEIDCAQCLALVAEFAERKLVGRSIRDALAAVEQHVSVCAECREEYEALQRVLDTLDD